MRIRTISILVVAISSMLLARPAGAWREDHHPGIVTDALDYMLDHSDDALMQAAAEWLWWAPGSNHLLMDKDYYLDPEPRCHENADGYPGYYSAACALRAETSNSDWYSDMFAVINPRGLYAACILPDFRPDYCELGTSLLVSAEVLATAGMGTIGMVLPSNARPITKTWVIYTRTWTPSVVDRDVARAARGIVSQTVGTWRRCPFCAIWAISDWCGSTRIQPVSATTG